MKTDDTIKSICIEISQDVKHEKDIDISPQEVFHIANSQFIGMAVARNKGLSVKLSYFASFIFKNKKAYIESVKEIEKLKDQVSEKEYKAIVKQKRIDNKNAMKASNQKLVTELKDLPGDIGEGGLVKYWNNIYNKIIESNE